MAAHALAGDALKPRHGLVHRLEEIREQEAFGEAAEPRGRRQTRLRCLVQQDLGDFPSGVAAGEGHAAEQADAFAGAGEEFG